MAQGYLQVDVVSGHNIRLGIADIVIARTEEPDELLKTQTNSCRTDGESSLDAPPLELSLLPGAKSESICRIHDPNHSTGI